jgi:cell division protein FtsA
MARESPSTGRSKASSLSDVAAFLDIGTAKTACLIARCEPDGARTVLGAGLRSTRGLKAGVVVEMDGVEQAIRGAVSDAEAAAGLPISEVKLAVACGRLRAQTFAADAQIARHHVTSADVARVLQAGAAFAEKDGRVLLDLEAVGFRVDGVPAGSKAIGLGGRMLGADLVALTSDEAPLVNLMHVVDRAELATAALVASPYASALGATRAQDRHAGVLCVDLGAGTTQIAMFAEGHLLLCDVIPVGGNHITFDIARALGTTLPEAERIKRCYGTLFGSADELGEVFTYSSRPWVDHMNDSSGHPGEFRTASAARGDLQSLIDARMTSLFAHVAERLERSSLPQYARRMMVLTGGASQLPGTAEAAAAFFRQPVVAGLVPEFEGLSGGFSGPHMAAVAGLALAPPGYHVRSAGSAQTADEQGVLQRVGRWLRGS